MIAGTGLVAGGASAFNQIIEREPDALMQRTRLRPMPDGRLPTRDAWIFGTVLIVAGLAILALGANLLSAAVALRDAGVVRRRLHAAQAALVVRDRHRRDPGSAAAGHRLGRGARRAVAGRVGPLRHRLSVAAAALPGDRVDLSRGLRARGVPDAAGHRAGRPQHGAPGGHLRAGAPAGQPGPDARRHGRARSTSRARSC